MDNSLTTPSDASRLKLAYLYAGTGLYQPGEILGPRLLKDFEAVLIIEGFPSYKTDRGEYKLEPGAIVLALPGSHETYHWDAHAQTRHAYFHFDFEVVPSDWPEPSKWPCCRLRPARILDDMFRHIVDRAAWHADWPTQCPAVSDNRIFEAFLDLYINPPEAFDEPVLHELSEPVRRAAKYMRERIESPVLELFTLDELAKAAHVSSKHLCRMFQKELGVSPMRAFRLMQFQLAVSLLARSNLNVKEIANRCGFPDQLYFSRSFSSTYGISPSQLRRDMKEGLPPPASLLPHSYSLTPRLHW